MAITNLIPWKRGEKQVPVKREEIQNPIAGLQSEMNRLFDDFFSGAGLRPFGVFGEEFGSFEPRVDLSESEKALNITAELPGLDEKDIEVSLARNMVTISGEKKAEKENKGENFYHLERAYGTFQRRIPLPCDIETNQVEATFKKGVLSIILPKTPEAQKSRKKITVKVK